MTPRYCALIPTYNNPLTVGKVVEQVRKHIDAVIVVDDGSHADGHAACRALASRGQARVIRLDSNCGKGAAVKQGLEVARETGFSHAFQVDADGQHNIDAIPAFLDASSRSPKSAIIGYPTYDASVPTIRYVGRRFTRLWVDLEVGSRSMIRDAMIGFRIYPIEPLLLLSIQSDRMEFDVEAVVKLAWAEISIINLPVGVRYLTPAEGGISHFDPLRDNLRMTRLHSRLCARRATQWCLRRLQRGSASSTS